MLFRSVINKGDVKLLEMNAKTSAVDGIISGAPELISKVKEIFAKDKGEKAE